jgi:hypothetical protein
VFAIIGTAASHASQSKWAARSNEHTSLQMRGLAMKLSAIIIATALLGGMAAQAQDAPSPEHLAAREATHKACATDEKSLCDGKQGREIFQCLRANNDKLSAGCKDALAKLGRPGGPQPAK